MWRSFHDMRRHLDRVVDRQLAEAGLSAAEFELLGPLSENDEGLRAKHLGNLVGWDRSRVAHMLRRMEVRGLVSRRTSTDDARGTVVTITAQGRAILAGAAPGHVQVVRQAFVEVLDPAERQLLTRMSQRVRNALDAVPMPGRPAALDRAAGPSPR